MNHQHKVFGNKIALFYLTDPETTATTTAGSTAKSPTTRK